MAHEGFDREQAEVITVTYMVQRYISGQQRVWTATTKDFTVTHNPERGMWRVATTFGGKEIATHGDTVDAAILAALHVIIEAH